MEQDISKFFGKKEPQLSTNIIFKNHHMLTGKHFLFSPAFLLYEILEVHVNLSNC